LRCHTFNWDLLVVKSDSDGGLYNYIIPGAIRALYCVPEHRPSIVVNPMRLMLLMMVLFGAAPQMITLPTKVAMAFACVDAISFGEMVKICASYSSNRASHARILPLVIHGTALRGIRGGANNSALRAPFLSKDLDFDLAAWREADLMH